MTFDQVIERYRVDSGSKVDLGTRFEKLMRAYLLTVPLYKSTIKDVWMWNDFFAKDDLGGNDLGIDLVAYTHFNEYWAIQCKCYQDASSISKKDIDTFLSTSARSFKDRNGETAQFTNRLFISTTNNWSSNAEESLRNQNPPVTTISLSTLQNANVDWYKLENYVQGEDARRPTKEIRPDQKIAMDKVNEYFKTSDRGKLIMACGTGKTFTSLRIAENETNGKGLILFLVPSIALVGQTLNEWSDNAKSPINAICICSDPEVSKRKKKNEEDIIGDNISNLAMPASTNVNEILYQFKKISSSYQSKKNGMTVVFSTYQSIKTISEAQKVLVANGYPIFDLIICDEAHRTTGVTLAGEDESAFIKVHDNDFIKAKKRLYMTATPKLYSDTIKSKVAENDGLLCSMDDVEEYGEEIHRIGFGEAVNLGLLTDYKVMILALNEDDVKPSIQKMIAGETTEIETDDLTRLIGCINALSKNVIGDNGTIKASDPLPMKRAVAFCPKITESQKTTQRLNTYTDRYIATLTPEAQKEMISVSAKHIDGTMSASTRDDLMSWLKADIPKGQCRVLTNVRCLSEGVDVPSLDAVMFISPKNSQIEVVQSVGRVMRRSEGKKYGYIVIPIVIPSGVEPENALDDNEKYKVVWTVLQALRSHDDRFNATINKIELNKTRPDIINVLKPGAEVKKGEGTMGAGTGKGKDNEQEKPDESYQKIMAEQLRFKFEELQDVMFAKIVKRVGSKKYWDEMANNVKKIAESQIKRISEIVGSEKYAVEFDKFLMTLQKDINPGITKQKAVEMLSQHIITQPIFDALFEGYSFTKNNPVSIAMSNILNSLSHGEGRGEGYKIKEEMDKLQKDYDELRKIASGFENAEAKQKFIVKLYDVFFKTAFPQLHDELGIVYTPVEIVDFIINSVNDILKQEFGRSISDENVNILDPFTGTGTFITRLLQSGMIRPEDITRKYQKEIYANELVLLAYYIAAVNIENVYHELKNSLSYGEGRGEGYHQFNGICLTDTFQLYENDDSKKIQAQIDLEKEIDPSKQNSARVEKQKQTPITVIVGNPPYRIGQESANDNTLNLRYSKLEAKIFNTYQSIFSGTGKKALYDSYIKAFRWSSDRIGENEGIISFVCNAGWLDGNSTAGFRKCLEGEFSKIYVINLRGNGRTSGELCRKEGEPLFAAHGGKGGSLAPISIVLLVKNHDTTDNAEINYYDIGDYLKRKDKLSKVKLLKSINHLEWITINPNEHGDWIKQRNDIFNQFIFLGNKKDVMNSASQCFFNDVYSYGLVTNRDIWVWNFNKDFVDKNVNKTIIFYTEELKRFNKEKNLNTKISVRDFIRYEPTSISWDERKLIGGIEKNKTIVFNEKSIRLGFYRPFCSQYIYFNDQLCHSLYLNRLYFPTENHKNIVICLEGTGSNREFGCLVSKELVDMGFSGVHTQCFPLYYYEARISKKKKTSTGEDISTKQTTLFDVNSDDEYIRHEGVSDWILNEASKKYSLTPTFSMGEGEISKEDIFYYVYGFLHCPEYRKTFANDLKKMLPRIPLVDDVKDFWAFSKAGRELADLHLNYENQGKYAGVHETHSGNMSYKVMKMKYKDKDKTKIIYNEFTTIENIPLQAYDYIVNGKSAIDWIMERYQITTHKESGITNDPNDWCEETGNPRYIIDLLHSVINLSVKTVEIVKALPKVKFE